MDEIYNDNIKSPAGAYAVLSAVDWLRLSSSGLTTKVLLNAASRHRDQDLIAKYTKLPGLEGKFPDRVIRIPDPIYKGYIITGSPPNPGKLEFEFVVASPSDYRMMDLFVKSFLPSIPEGGYIELYDPNRRILWMAMVPGVVQRDIDGITIFDDADLERLRTLTPQTVTPYHRRLTERMPVVAPPAEPTLRGKK